MNRELPSESGERRQGLVGKFRRGIHQILHPEIGAAQRNLRRQIERSGGRASILARSGEAALATAAQVERLRPARTNQNRPETEEEREWRQAQEALQTGRGLIVYRSSEGDHISPDHLHQLQPEEWYVDEQEK